MDQATATEASAEARGEFSSWEPLPRPDHRLYATVLAEIRDLADSGQERKAKAYFRAICEKDFPFFMLHAHSFGRYECSEPGHKHQGKPWMTWPWVWERACELHEDFVERRTGKLYVWSRIHFKTALITSGSTCWETLRNPQTTTAIITWKYEDTGVTIFKGVRTEFELNQTFLSHWPHILTEESRRSYTNRHLTVAREPGPKEPTVSIHGIDSIPDSQHYDRVLVDDAVVRKTVATPERMRSTYEAMQDLSALCGQRPYLVTIGTRWHLNDPYRLGIDDEKYDLDFHSCYHPGTKEPVLHTKDFLDHHLRDMGKYRFSAHFLGQPVPPSEQRLVRSWLRHYERTPAEEAEGKRRYLVVDPAEGAVGSDPTALTDIGTGEDRNFYILDMVRERIGLIGTVEAIFKMVRLGRHVAVYIEGYSGSRPVYDAVLERQRVEGFRFTIKMLPAVSEPKEQRVSYLISGFEAGRYWLPAKGFGHGSAHDPGRDTADQFKVLEYDVWSPAGTVGEDHTLDTLAWTAHPETRKFFTFPEAVSATTSRDYVGHPSIAERERPTVGSGVSPWVW